MPLIILVAVLFFSCQALTKDLQMLEQGEAVKTVDCGLQTLAFSGQGSLRPAFEL